MKSLLAAVIVACVTVTTASAGDGPFVKWQTVEFALPKSANAEADVRNAIAKGDLRFVGVCGFAVDIPGLKDSEKHLVTPQGVKVIAGTTDATNDPAEHAFNTAAESYALTYNRLLKEHLRERENTR